MASLQFGWNQYSATVADPELAALIRQLNVSLRGLWSDLQSQVLFKTVLPTTWSNASGFSAGNVRFWAQDGTATDPPTWVNLATYGVTGVKGTANQVLANGGSGSFVVGQVTLTTPQNIDTGAAVQFGRLGLNTAPGAQIVYSTVGQNASGGVASGWFVGDSQTATANNDELRGFTFNTTQDAGGKTGVVAKMVRIVPNFANTPSTGYAIFINDVTGATTNFAIKTGLGQISFGDQIVAGSIGGSFGSINIGSNAITCGAITASGTVTLGSTFTGIPQLGIGGAGSQRIGWSSTDAGADLKTWRSYSTNTGHWILDALKDDGSAANPAIDVGRSGATPNLITLYANTLLNTTDAQLEFVNANYRIGIVSATGVMSLVTNNTVGLSIANSGAGVTVPGTLGVTGATTLSTLGAFAAGDKYVIADASGHLHISSLGPAS